MRHEELEFGHEELRKIRRKLHGLLISAALFSVFVNLLMLTAPIYMLQIYDRVLSSRSVETLVALTLLMTFLFIVMGCLDYARGRILARAGARFQAGLDERVFRADLDPAQVMAGSGTPPSAVRDADAIRQLLASPVVTALFDMPWTPVFLLAITLFHPWLGALALSGGALLVAVTLTNQALTRGPASVVAAQNRASDQLAERLQTEAPMVRALGLTDHAFQRWQQVRRTTLRSAIHVSDRQSQFAVFSKTFRQFLQSAMLGLGAYLAVQGAISPGAMIAGSILLSRALAPVDLAIGQWPLVQRARSAWLSLAQRLTTATCKTDRTALPTPASDVHVNNLTVIPEGHSYAVLRGISFHLKPGTALGVIGPTGAGKSTLAQVLTGTRAPSAGTVRLGGAALDHYASDALGRIVGYLPQRVLLFDGTIAENIAGFCPKADDATVIAAAQAADAHDLILSLPQGYDTKVTSGNNPLSGGQMQRICLARALFGTPPLVILDEPNSNLDHDGSVALNAAIQTVKLRGGAVVIMAHRPAAIQHCDMLMVLDDGCATEIGPRDEILRKRVRNAAQIHSIHGIGGGFDDRA
ncbi:type I secretion system permease/ATPase [Aliiroseovarius sediminis]|uniref:type I secretion system permease/ATPase n=1 Tax=Aliiroseovarius sediminis TaxID=2925839 RepID=UPI001F58693E|nr:type I secretion system permease/ATPase [Aliiroseovarius sediminis]MCI2395495.1 type I secretion system permease/ATPase [Aliiroseovarius sediminis]